MADQIQDQQREQLTGQIPRNFEPENDGKEKTQTDLEVSKETNTARDSRHGNSEDPGEKSSEYPEEGNSKDFIEKRNSEYPGKGNSGNSGSGSSDGPQEGNTTNLGDGKSVGLEEVNSEDLTEKGNSKDPQKGNSGTGNSENPREVSHGDLKECSLHTHTAAMTSQRPQVVEKRPSDQSHEFDYDGRSKNQKVDFKDGNNNITTAQELSIHHNEIDTSTMASQIPAEQHQQGAKKRPRDGEAENDDKGKRQKVDSEDSSGDSDTTDSTGDKMEVPQKQVPLDAIDGRRTKADHTESCTIQAVLRRGQNARQRPGGSYMRARLEGSEKTAELDFTGTDPDDSSTVFHVEKNDDREDVNVLRFTDKAKGDNYYMRVYRNGRVKLRKLVNYPTNDKYLFYIKSISCMIGCPMTFKSVQTREYLSCDEKGKASMLEMTTTDGKGEPKDRRAWFCCHKIDENLVEF